MSDLLFVELGAVVKEVLARSECKYILFCSVETPTYTESCVVADFKNTLKDVLDSPLPLTDALTDVKYDQDQVNGSPLLGPNWPGAAYEGVVRIRESSVTGALTAAWDSLPGYRYEYQVVASVDEQNKTVKRYRGFHAKVVEKDGALWLQVAYGGTGRYQEQEPKWALKEAWKEVPYDPADTNTFYSGAVLADKLDGAGKLYGAELIKAGATPGSSGAVFISFDAAFGIEVPKQPPGAGL